MRRSLLRDDHGGADLPTVIIACVVTLATIGAGTMMALNAIDHFEDNQVREDTKAVAAELEQLRTKTGSYAGADEILDQRNGFRMTLGQNDGCFTLVAASNKKAFFIESNNAEPTVLEKHNTATCAGETALRSMLTDLSLSTAGRTGAEVLQPPTGFTEENNSLAWKPVQGATSYKVEYLKNGVGQAPATVTAPNFVFSAVPGDSLRFTIQAVGSEAQSVPTQYISRYEPVSPVANSQFESTGQWTKEAGSGSFESMVPSGSCARTSADKAAALGDAASILSSEVLAAKVGGPGAVIRLSFESCGPVLPAVQFDHKNSRHGVSAPMELKSEASSTAWGLRHTVEYQLPQAVAFKVRIMNPAGDDQVWVDNVNITAVR